MAETTSTEPTEEVIETQINDLDPRFIKQLESAEKSIDKNPGYTVDICATILAKYPSCVEVRKIMRRLSLENTERETLSRNCLATLKELFSL